MDFGVIQSVAIATNLESGENVRLAQVNLEGEDTVTVELPFSQGDEVVPEVGDTVYFSEVDSGMLIGMYIQSGIPVDDSLGEGDRELFSKSGANRMAKMRLKNDGVIVLNDGDDFAVRFTKLESAINDLVNILSGNSTKLSTHIHLPTGPGLITGPPLSPTQVPVELESVTADISAAKVEEVML